MCGMTYTRAAALEKPLFDPSGFDTLVVVAGVEAVVNLAGVFESEARKRITHIEAAVNGSDLSAIESATHALGSSAGTFGAQRIHILARAAEAACVEDDAELAISLSRDILEIADESLNLATAYVATLAPAPV